MRIHGVRRAAAALACLAAWGCTSLREVPRSEYAVVPERKNVRVFTNEGLVNEFDYARVANDTLTGYREQDTSGPIPEIASASFSLEEIAKLSVRAFDWYRTGLIGGGVLAGIVAAGLSRGSDHPAGDGNPGGGGPRPIP